MRIAPSALLNAAPLFSFNAPKTVLTGSAPRFGLKDAALKQHPNFNYELTLGQHLTKDAQGALHPTQRLIQDVANLYLEAGENDPKALVIPDVAKFVDDFDYTEGSKSFETIHAFQRELMEKAWQTVRNTRFPKSEAEDFLTFHYLNKEGVQERPPGGVRPDEWTLNNITQRKNRFSRQFQLGADVAMIGWTYGPIKGVQTQSLQLLDVSHALKDNQKSFKQMFQHTLEPHKAGHYLRDSVYDPAKLAPYTVDVPLKALNGKNPPVPMVIMNGAKMAFKPPATNPDPVDYQDDRNQMMFYASLIKLNRGRSFWKETEKIPYLDYWYHTGKEPSA
ncbi:MAG: hypothetical protein KTR14_07895 [Vampirovibrio sp.]|nr:hypothetical protein [Vampirovibrio sp.]